jgi:hypothetical protein
VQRSPIHSPENTAPYHKANVLAFIVHFPGVSSLLGKELREMKFKSLFIVSTAFLVPALAFAGQRNSAGLELDQAVAIAGTQLAPGQYKLIWEGNGPNVIVSFVEGKKTVATAPAKLVTNTTNEEAIETATAADKTVILQAVDLKNVTIQFTNAVAGAGN